MILYDGNYGLGAHCIWHGLGAYGMDLVHNREPEQSPVTI